MDVDVNPQDRQDQRDEQDRRDERDQPGERSVGPDRPAAAAMDGAVGRAVDEAPAAWRRAWRAGAAVWLASDVGYAVIMIAAWLGRPGPASLGGALRAWRQWDVGWYTLIAQYGYTGLSGIYRLKAPAFPPLYPLLMRLADPVLPGDVV